MSEERGIPYSIGEAKALAEDHPDPYVREMLEWLIGQAEKKAPRRYFRFGHSRTSGFIRFFSGPVKILDVNVKSSSFDDLRYFAQISYAESLRPADIYRQSPQMESVYRNGPSRWMEGWQIAEYIEEIKGKKQ